MKSGLFTGKIFIFSLILFLVFANNIYAKTKKSDITDTQNLTNDLDKKIALQVPSKKWTYFSGIDANIVKNVEIGVPSSLKQAMSDIRKSESEYSENEKVLIKVASEIMRIVWPSQYISWKEFNVSQDTAYEGAIESAKKGIFELSAGNSDFLSIILPSLVIFSNNVSPSDFDLCLNAATSALELNPDSFLALYIIGYIYEKKSDFENAENYYKKVYESNSTILEITLAYSRVLLSLNKSQEASVILKLIEDKDISDINVLKQKAFSSFANKDFNSAEQYVARVLQQRPNDLEFLLLRARILVEKNDYIHAVSLLDMYARQNDSDIDYLVLRARVQLDWSKNTVAATETVEKALKLHPDNIDALIFAARISALTDSPVSGKYADEIAKRIIQLDPSNDEANLYALSGLINQKNWQDAYNISKNLIKNKNNSPDLVLQHVTICLKLNKKSEAYDLAYREYRANPKDETLIQTYVYAVSEVNSKDSAMSIINGIINDSSTKIKSYLYFRRSYLQPNEELSLADLRSSLIANPRNSEALFRLYEIYFAKSEYRKAQYYLRQVVAINPNDSSIKKLNDALTKLID